MYLDSIFFSLFHLSLHIDLFALWSKFQNRIRRNFSFNKNLFEHFSQIFPRFPSFPTNSSLIQIHLFLILPLLFSWNIGVIFQPQSSSFFGKRFLRVFFLQIFTKNFKIDFYRIFNTLARFGFLGNINPLIQSEVYCFSTIKSN